MSLKIRLSLLQSPIFFQPIALRPTVVVLRPPVSTDRARPERWRRSGDPTEPANRIGWQLHC